MVLAWLRGFPEKRNYRPTTPHIRHVARNEPIAFDDLVNTLRVRYGLAEPPAGTLPEQVRAASEPVANEVT